MSVKGLYVITGKGGVGKSTLALSLTRYLHQSGRKVIYNNFSDEVNFSVCHHLDIPYWELSLEESAKTYMGRKLNSETIASWIMKTPFFNSLFNMIPGLGQMIFLGHIIDRLLNDRDLTIVLDSPATGHALSMFEAPLNFKEMFGSGAIVEDIIKMENFIKKKDGLKTIVACLPNTMSVNEGKELKEELSRKNLTDIELMINDSLLKMNDLDINKLPEFLRKKINMETTAFEKIQSSNNKFVALPHIPLNSQEEIILALTPLMGDLL